MLNFKKNLTEFFRRKTENVTMRSPSDSFGVFLSENLFAVRFLKRNDCKTKSGLDKDSKKIFKFHWGKKSSINSRKNIPLGLFPTTDFLPLKKRVLAGIHGPVAGS